MTILLIDQPLLLNNKGEEGLLLEYTAVPHIFVAREKYLLVITLSRGVTDIPREGEVWDANIGWHFRAGETWSNEHHTPYVLPENTGKAHSKITFRRREAATAREINDNFRLIKLSEILSKAPRFDRPGGNRGAQAAGVRQYHKKRGKMVRVGELWLPPDQLQNLLTRAGEAGLDKWDYIRQVLKEA